MDGSTSGQLQALEEAELEDSGRFCCQVSKKRVGEEEEGAQNLKSQSRTATTTTTTTETTVTSVRAKLGLCLIGSFCVFRESERAGDKKRNRKECKLTGHKELWQTQVQEQRGGDGRGQATNGQADKLFHLKHCQHRGGQSDRQKLFTKTTEKRAERARETWKKVKKIILSGIVAVRRTPAAIANQLAKIEATTRERERSRKVVLYFFAGHFDSFDSLAFGRSRKSPETCSFFSLFFCLCSLTRE